MVTFTNSEDPEEMPTLFHLQTKKYIFLPPANFVCGGVYCFHVVRACVRPSVRP